MGGVVGEFFRSFGLTVAFATLCSLFVSFTLTPMLAARWYQKGESIQATGRFGQFFDRNFEKFESGYQNLLRRALRRPWLVVIVANLILIVIFATIGPKLGFQFAPDQDRNSVSVSIEGPPGSSLSYTENICSQVEKIIRSDKRLSWDTKFISTTVGTSAVGGGGVTGTQYATINLQLWDKKSALDYLNPFNHDHMRPNSDASDAQYLRPLLTNIPGAKINAANQSGFGGGAPLEVDVTGTNFNKLIDAANKVEAMMKAIHGTYDVDMSFKNSQPEAQIRLDRDKAPELGLNLNTVSNNLADSVAGNTDAKFRDPVDGQQYTIRTQLSDDYRDNPDKLNNLIVGYDKNNQPILLGQVAQVTNGTGPVKIDRLNRERDIAITGYLIPGVAVGNVMQILTPEINNAHFDQVSWTTGGQAQLMTREGGYMAIAVILGITLSYMLMAALFNNLVYPLSIMLSLPQAWAGALIALYVTGQPLSLIAMIGIILLNGIVNKNAILLVDYTNTLRARGYQRIDALLEAGPVRMRPIMMTTLAIVVSSIPTALALGRGAGFRQSLGIAVIGGVTLALAITPLVIPCAYLIFDNFTNWLIKVRGKIFKTPPPAISLLGDYDTRVGYANGANGGSSVPITSGKTVSGSGEREEERV
jgi:HAE1 family hydrophobic/amphiphilic exporter-1